MLVQAWCGRQQPAQQRRPRKRRSRQEVRQRSSTGSRGPDTRAWQPAVGRREQRERQRLEWQRCSGRSGGWQRGSRRPRSPHRWWQLLLRGLSLALSLRRLHVSLILLEALLSELLLLALVRILLSLRARLGACASSAACSCSSSTTRGSVVGCKHEEQRSSNSGSSERVGEEARTRGRKGDLKQAVKRKQVSTARDCRLCAMLTPRSLPC